jgi:uncharacterized lipoprotein YmbA
MAGCASAPPDHFYTLIGNPSAPAAGQALPNAALAVAIESVTLPEEVDRAELVIRTGPNSVRILEDRRWAEPLKGAISRAVADNLSDLLGGATVSIRSDRASRDAKYLVSIDVTRFDSMQNEAAVVEALWSISLAANGAAISAATGAPVISGRSMLRVPVHGDGFEELVAAQARALADLSGEIAAQIKKIESPLN